MKHKHCDLIVAWANGAEIQWRFAEDKRPNGEHWKKCMGTPSWHNDIEYRIKPEPKPDVVVEENIGVAGYENPYVYVASLHNGNVRFTFDGETHKLKKVEML